MCAVLSAFPNLFLYSRLEFIIPPEGQSMIEINCPLLILTDSLEFLRKLNIAGMVKMCGNEAKVTSRRSDENWGNLYTRDLSHSNIFLPSEYHLFYLEVNLMPYGFLFTLKLGSYYRRTKALFQKRNTEHQ